MTAQGRNSGHPGIIDVDLCSTGVQQAIVVSENFDGSEGGGDESPTEEVLAIGTPVLVVHPVGNDPDLVPKENVQTTVVLKSTAYMESKPNKKKKATTISVVPLVNNQEPEVVTWNSAQGAGQHMEVSIVEKYDRSKPPVGVKIIKARGHRTRCVEDGSR
ncbi:hypothetical protein V6N13_106522 [Hibiscus sabdariffa]